MIPAVAVVLGALAFAPGIADMWGRWFAADSYYSHGPLVPLLSLWLVWSERRHLAEVPVRSAAFGLVLVALSVLVLLASLVEDVHFTQNFAMLGALAGGLLVTQGWPRVRRLWFPLAFLVFMIPLPQIAIARLTFDLKILAARIAVGAIDMAGIPVVLEGSTIHLPDVSVTVDDVCSGLRTLIALVAMGALFAYFERSRGRAVLVLVLSAPIAILANCVRVLLLCWLASIGHPAAQEGPLHDATGLAVYAVALGLLLGLRTLWAPGPADDEAPRATLPGAILHRQPRPLWLGCLVGLLALGGAGSAFLSLASPPLPPTDRTRAIPLEVAGWSGTDEEVAPRVHQILGTTDVLVRTYDRPGMETPVVLYVVHAADSRKVAHPPEICFSGGGFVAREHGDATLLAGDREIPAVRMVLDRPPSTLVVYYWYRLGGLDTASYVGHQFEAVLGRLSRESHEGSMVRLSTSVVRGDVRRAEDRIARFARDVLPEVLGALP